MMHDKRIIWRSGGGFTLLEVLVGLIIGTLVIGGVMGMISSSLNYRARLQARSAAQPVLEAAAQQILAEPETALKGSVAVGGGRDAAMVQVMNLKVDNPDARPLGKRQSELYQVKLLYAGQSLEFSVLVPQPER
jgi:Tfp pilus assembly protein PilV